MKKNISLLFVWVVTTLFAIKDAAALGVTISQQRNACNQILTASVTGGSGNYQLGWGVSSGCTVPSNSSQTVLITNPCGNNASYYVFVVDLNTDEQAFASIPVSKILTGSLSVSLPNVITPNGDGINDTFNIQTASSGNGPTNAHTVNVKIYNRWGSSVFNQTYSDFNSGIVASYPTWNGGNSAAGAYFVEVVASNCTASQSYTVQLQLLR